MLACYGSFMAKNEVPRKSEVRSLYKIFFGASSEFWNFELEKEVSLMTHPHYSTVTPKYGNHPTFKFYFYFFIYWTLPLYNKVCIILKNQNATS